MSRTRWSRQANRQLDQITNYLLEQSPAFVESQLSLINYAVKQLPLFPNIGRPGRIDGTRELIINGTPYIVAYRVGSKKIDILGILHAARRWPGSFPE